VQCLGIIIQDSKFKIQEGKPGTYEGTKFQRAAGKLDEFMGYVDCISSAFQVYSEVVYF
jgi:hypothetical protein